MPVDITDVDEFTDPISAVADGDPVAASSDDPAIQGLANRTRNLLNLFATGTWTPTIVASGTNNVTMSEQEGKYSRVGSLVVLNARVRGNIGASTGALRVGGLPYTANLEGIIGELSFVAATPLNAPYGLISSLEMDSVLVGPYLIPHIKSGDGSRDGSIGGAFISAADFYCTLMMAFSTDDAF